MQRKLELRAANQRLTDKYSVLAHEAQILDPIVDSGAVRPMLRLEATDPLSVLLKRKGLEDVNDRDFAGRTALHYAAYEGNLAQVLLTIEAGADVDGLDLNGFSPLHLATLNGHEAVMYRLMTCKADPWRINFQGLNALSLAENAGRHHIASYLRGSNPGFPVHNRPDDRLNGMDDEEVEEEEEEGNDEEENEEEDERKVEEEEEERENVGHDRLMQLYS